MTNEKMEKLVDTLAREIVDAYRRGIENQKAMPDFDWIPSDHEATVELGRQKVRNIIARCLR